MMVTVQDIAKQYGVPARKLRKEFRLLDFPWHKKGERWQAENGTTRCNEMRLVARDMAKALYGAS